MEQSSTMDRQALKTRIMACQWHDLAPHFARGALLLVSPGLDLLDAASAIAADDASAVAGLLDSGGLAKLSDAQATHYQDRADARFQFIILQPYVLAQEIPAARDKQSN